MAKSLKISRNVTIGILAVVIVICLFIFYKKRDNFSAMYDAGSSNPIGVSRPNGFRAIKLTNTSRTLLTYLDNLAKDQKDEATAKASNISTDQDFVDCLTNVVQSLIAKAMFSPLKSIYDGLAFASDIPLIKCTPQSFNQDCFYFSETQSLAPFKFDKNPIDKPGGIAQSISEELSKVFNSPTMPDLLVDKILDSQRSGGKVLFLESIKDFINDTLEEITNMESDAFYVYYRVDYDLNESASSNTDKIQFRFVDNTSGHLILSQDIADIDNVATTQTEAPEMRVDCVMNFPPFGNCIENQGSVCIPTPHIPGQFGTKLGTQTRTSFIDIQPRGGGNACPNSQTEERQCYIPCENPILNEPLEEKDFSEFKSHLKNNSIAIRSDAYRSREDATYLINGLGIMTLSVDSDDNLVRSNIPNKIVQDCNNFNISTLYLRTFEDDGNYTKDLVILNPKTELCTGKPHQRSNLEGSLCSDSCTFTKRSSEDYESCLTRCSDQCSLACCQSACFRQNSFIEPFTSGTGCSFQPYGNTLSECKENCKNDGCESELTCGEICGNCSSISCRWTLPDFNGTSEKPTSPNIIATPGNNSATIIWNRSDDRGSRIERYIVTAYETTNPENGVRIELATNPSCTNCIHRIEKLKNNVSYTLGVSAVNNGGVSRMSNTVVVIPTTTSIDMSFVQSIQKDAIANVNKDKDMLKNLIDKIVLGRGNVDDQTLSDLLTYRNKPEQNTLKDLLSKMAGSTIEITI